MANERIELAEGSTTNRLDRRVVLGAAGAAFCVAGVSAPTWALLAEEDWRPRTLSTRQVTDVQTLVEALIPRTETPGAVDVLVDRYIDLALSLESESQRQAFSRGLDALDALAKMQFGKRIRRLSEGEVVALLNQVSDQSSARAQDAEGSELLEERRFFRDLKQRTVFAYYTSRDGWVEELGMPAGPFTSRFRGCAHQGPAHADGDAG